MPQHLGGSSSIVIEEIHEERLKDKYTTLKISEGNEGTSSKRGAELYQMEYHQYSQKKEVEIWRAEKKGKKVLPLG